MSLADRFGRWTLLATCSILSVACFALIAPPAQATARVVLRSGAGPAGAKLVLAGSNFSSRRAMAVTSGGRVLARGRTTRKGTFRLSFRAPAGASVALVTRSGRRKVVTVRRAAPTPSESGEIAAEGGRACAGR